MTRLQDDFFDYVNGEWENRKVKCEIYVNI